MCREPDSLSHEEPIAPTRHQAEVIARQDAQMNALAAQLSPFTRALALFEYLVPRNSFNSPLPRRTSGPGAPGTAPAWRRGPDRVDRFPQASP